MKFASVIVPGERSFTTHCSKCKLHFIAIEDNKKSQDSELTLINSQSQLSE